MADTFTPEERSAIMRQVRSKNTSPEKKVRSLLHLHGYRFRVHCDNLPGKPDIVLKKYRTVVFVNGCFWHRHENCRRASTPTSNKEYWLAKFERNQSRDQRDQILLNEQGWQVLIVWECELGNPDQLVNRLSSHFKETEKGKNITPC